MEEKRLSSGFIALLIVLIVVILGLAGYIIYDSVIDKDNKASDKDKTATQIDEVKTLNLTEIFFNGLAFIYNEEAYVNFKTSSGYLTVDDIYEESITQTATDTIQNKYQEYTFDGFNYNNDKVFKGLKLNTKDVKGIYTYDEGQTLSNRVALIILHNDSTLSVISMYSLLNGKTDVTKIDNLNNIANIVTEVGNGATTYAVTVSGERINISSYIPTDYHTF